MPINLVTTEQSSLSRRADSTVARVSSKLADTLDRALSGERPPTDPTARAAAFDWDAIAEQAERRYRDAIA